MVYRERVTIEPGKRSGKPSISGMRITVGDVLGYLAALHDFPELEHEEIRPCFAFAADAEHRTTFLSA